MVTKHECAQKQHGTSTRSGVDVHVYCLRPKSLSDAEALGKSLAANSVQGADLLRFTVDSLRSELNLNMFAAQKFCDLRDELLR